MLCTPSSFCSAKFPCREEEHEETDQKQKEDQKRRRRMGIARDWEGGLPHAVNPQQPLQRRVSLQRRRRRRRRRSGRRRSSRSRRRELEEKEEEKKGNGKEWRVTGKGGSPMLCTRSSFCSAAEKKKKMTKKNKQIKKMFPPCCAPSAASAALYFPAEKKKTRKKKKQIKQKNGKGRRLVENEKEPPNLKCLGPCCKEGQLERCICKRSDVLQGNALSAVSSVFRAKGKCRKEQQTHKQNEHNKTSQKSAHC